MRARSTGSISLSLVLGFGLLPHCGPGTPDAVTPVAPAPSVSVSASASTSASAVVAAPVRPWPATDRRPVTDHYTASGKDVVDDYRWLEDSASPEVKAWSAAQNAYARKVLDGSSKRGAVHGQVAKLMSGSSADWSDVTVRGKRLFAMKEQPPKQQPLLVVLTSAEDAKSEKVVFDPNVADPSGKTAIDWYVPSHDGKLVAISLSKGGSESGDLHVFEIGADGAGKERAGDTIAHVNNGTAGGSLAWRGDDKGFFYTRYPRPGEKTGDDVNFFQQVYEHTLGKAEKDDVYALGKDFPRIAEIELHAAHKGGAILARMSNGDGGEFSHFYFDGKAWVKIADATDKLVHATFGHDGAVYAVSLKDAPRGKVIKLSAKALGEAVKSAGAKGGLRDAEEIVPQSDVVIEQLAVTEHKLFVADLVGGPSQIRSFELAAPKAKKGPPAVRVGSVVPIPNVSAVGQIVALGGDDVLYRNQSFTEPPAWWSYDAKKDKSHKTQLFVTSPASFDDAEVVRATCTSKDGTKVPMSILRKKGIALDGTHLALVNGYGGYSVNRPPRFDATRRVWLDHGGVFAHTNIRGGGEYGEAWHLQGNLTKKQNVFDDFAACAAELSAEKYTTPAKTAILGGSNGGLLMGAELTQHPDAFGAVVSLVGIYDMLRVELTPNGAFNVTEFGTVKDPAQFDALFGYSPYHHVVDGTKYPPTLFMTGANDPRVDPWHSRKMVARLQAAAGSDAPILLRTSDETGHGIGSPLSAEIDQTTDIFTFLLSTLE